MKTLIRLIQSQLPPAMTIIIPHSLGGRLDRRWHIPRPTEIKPRHMRGFPFPNYSSKNDSMMNCPNHGKLLVIDIASVKQDIVSSFESLTNDHVEYISTHPMSGKEKSGFINSQATLFVNRPWIVVPHKKNSHNALERIQELIRYLGSDPMSLTAATHDQQAALVSHLPALISKAFLDFVHAVDPHSLKMAGPGFDSFTRLAHVNDQRRKEITTYNKEAIQKYFDMWLSHLIKNRGN